MNPSWIRKDEFRMDTSMQELCDKRIKAYRASGQTMRAWCGENDVTVHQLKYWLCKLRKQGARAGSSPAFRAVTVTDQSAETQLLWVQIGAARIAVHPGFEPKLLRDVVVALTSVC